MKKIRLFERFAGIGSQRKALKNIAKNEYEVISLGSVDFYIDAIISYMIIHHGYLKKETKLSRVEMIQKLSQYCFSSDSKKVVNMNYFSRMNQEKLQIIFPYLYAYVNNEYFINVYHVNERERERERATPTFANSIICLKTLTF
ncbi:DNA (cytosine-5-)-methyltransferase N-terminal subunit [[Mycoplasma] anseris]|uniref:DNA (cytosine-5-)-methyltransferase N-terminal subunit n=1 Tax=[Mycoplasma] anseris TaxID=92400 RepID=UPI00068EBEA4|nr:hypothetical protein [[Mycoplasma] anseris]